MAALAQALLDAAPRLRLLVTSQVPLRLAAERVWRLAPLAVPQGTLPAQQAQGFAAVALFAEHAHAGEEPLIRTRHARALRAAWDAAEAALQAGHSGVLAWRSEAEPELDAARDALVWACASGDDELALALASALVPRLPPALRDERKQVARLAESIVDRVPDVAAQQRAWTAMSFAGANRRPPIVRSIWLGNCIGPRGEPQTPRRPQARRPATAPPPRAASSSIRHRAMPHARRSRTIASHRRRNCWTRRIAWRIRAGRRCACGRPFVRALPWPPAVATCRWPWR